MKPAHGHSGSRPDASGSPRTLTFRNGGWVLLLAALLAVIVVGWHIISLATQRGPGAVGDGENVESYGYDLSTCLVPRETLVASGLPKDGLRALNDPQIWTLGQLRHEQENTRGKILVSTDRVIGVEVGGEARAYPLNILNWHEVVNDTLGGRPITVTYSPLCDSAVVFSRTVDGATLEFGFSGLVYNSNLVMYGRSPTGKAESLWSQLQARAIAGPAAEREQRLEIIPSDLLQWGDWQVLHPDTSVLARDPILRKQYKRSPYGTYAISDRLRFPVQPKPTPGRYGLKDRVVAIRSSDEWLVVPVEDALSAADPAGSLRFESRGTAFDIHATRDPETLIVRRLPDRSVPVAIPAYWFAWYAMYPEISPIEPQAGMEER